VRALALVLALTASTLACDFCMGGGATFTPLQREVAQNPTVALGELVGRVGEGRVRFAVTRVLKGTAPDEVTLDVAMFFLPRVTYLLLGKKGPERAIPLESSGVKYVQRVLAEPPPAKGHERLLWFLPYVAEKDRLVAASARQEFAEAPYAKVKALKPDLDAKRLMTWVKDRSTPAQSRGILLLLLGVSGSQEHLPQVEAWLEDVSLQGKPSYDALIATYLLLRGPDGLTRVRQVIESAEPGARTQPAIAFLAALRFLDREEEMLARDQFLGAVRPLLRHSAFAEVTVAELTRLKDWQSIDRVVALYGKHQRVALRKAVRDYLVACPDPRAKRMLEDLG
jgi:hypothetical protein